MFVLPGFHFSTSLLRRTASALLEIASRNLQQLWVLTEASYNYRTSRFQACKFCSEHWRVQCDCHVAMKYSCRENKWWTSEFGVNLGYTQSWTRMYIYIYVLCWSDDMTSAKSPIKCSIFPVIWGSMGVPILEKPDGYTYDMGMYIMYTSIGSSLW